MVKTKLAIVGIPTRQEETYFLILLGAIIITMPFEAIYNSMACMALLVFWIFFMPKELDWRRLRVGIAISALFWIACLGMTYTQNVTEGIFRLQQKSLLLIFPLVFTTIKLKWQNKLWFIWSTFIYTILFAVVFCLVGASIRWLRGEGIGFFFSESLAASGFNDLYTYILAFLCIAAMFLLMEALLGSLRLSSILTKPSVAISLILFLVSFVLLLGVRQSILFLILLILCYAFRLKKAMGFVLLVSGVFLIFVFYHSVPTLNSRVNEIVQEYSKRNPLDLDPETATPLNGIALRRALWICGVDVVKLNPVVGVGTGDAQDVLQVAYENRNFILASHYNRFNVHNQYLQNAVSLGLFGLSVWLISLGWLFVTFRKSWPFLCGLMMLVFMMFTESMLETNKGVLMTALLLTLLSSNCNQRP